MKRIAQFIVMMICTSLLMGCADVARRQKESLARLDYTGGTAAQRHIRDRLVAALQEATGKSLKTPHVVSAVFAGNLEEKKGFIVVDWISAQPGSDGLILNMEDGVAVTCAISEAYLKENEKESKSLVCFQAAIGALSHPDLWRDLQIESIISIQLTKDGAPVSNVCKFRTMQQQESGQPTNAP